MDENQNDCRWVRCPICGGKTRVKVCKDTYLLNFPLFCPKCKKETKISVANFRMALSITQDSKRK